jgi:hypothetical protein
MNFPYVNLLNSEKWDEKVMETPLMIDGLNLKSKESLVSPDLKKEVRYLFTGRGSKSNYLPNYLNKTMS